jgi:hypothetical protein
MTILFDLEAFRNGAVAINFAGEEVTYDAEKSDKYTLYYKGSSNSTNCPITWAVANWSMKPTDDDGWIAVNGRMPREIAEAKQFDWEYRLNTGKKHQACQPAGMLSYTFWSDLKVVAVRLVKPREVTLREYRSPNEFKEVTVMENVILGQVFKTSVKSVKQNETDQQRLTREASTRYFEKLHAKEKRVLPLGEMGIEDAIFSALCESFKDK